MQYGLVVVWLVAYLLLGFAALPVAGWLFPRFADRGASLAIPLALAVLGLVGFLVGHVSFGWPALVAGTLVLVAGAYLAEDAPVDERAYAEAAAVFAVAFLFLVAVRAVDPSVPAAGGEKFLDYGLLKATLRAGTLPPEDFWFAGEPVQYYYGGHVVAGLLTRLTFTAPRFGYNLALAGFYAAMVTAVYGLAGNVAAATGARRRLAAGLGAFFAAVAANLHTPAKLLVWALPPDLSRTAVSALGLPNDVVAWTPADFHYWNASRVITGSINEFPLFAWLNGDMHAHMMSTPFLLLAVGVAFAYWLTPETARRRRRVLVFGAMPAVAGLLAVVNTWSFPTAGGVLFLSVLFADADPATLFPAPVADRLGGDEAAGWRGEARRLGLALAAAGVMLAVALVVSLPFWLTSATGRGIAVVTPGSRTPLGELLLVHGAFLVAFVAYLGRRLLTRVEEAFDAALLGLGLFAAVAVGVLYQAAAVGVFVPLGLAAWYVLRARERGADRLGDVGFETVAVLGGVGLVLIVEFLYIESVIGRFNTLFKVYAQVWQLFALGMGVVLARLADAGDVTLSTPRSGAWRRAGRALVVVLVFSTALYAGFALPNHFGGDDPVADVSNPTLDATRFVEVYHPEEAAAIDWLDAREGTPTMASAPACGCNDLARYRWVNAPASLTGVPTLAGWGGPAGHEYIYRSPETFTERVEEVRQIYQGQPARQRELLAAHDVQYVYVGPNERELYGTITVQELDAVSVAESFGDGTVVIYEVDQDRL